jgi:hypothetical protein
VVHQYTNKTFFNPPVATAAGLPPSAPSGTIRFVVDEDCLYQYLGGVWRNVGVRGTGSFQADGSVPAAGDFNLAGFNLLNLGQLTSASSAGFNWLSKATNILNAVAFDLNTLYTLNATGTKLLRLRNNSVDMLVFDTDGDLNIAGDYMVNRTAADDDVTSSGERIIGITDTTYPRTVTISELDIRDGKKFIVKDESGGANLNPITVECEGSGHMIDGAPYKVINLAYGSLRLYGDGFNMFTY